jgi:hypothetical protein
MDLTSVPRELRPFMDEQGRLTQWPAKQKIQRMAVDNLAGRFDRGREYTEREVNELLLDWHTFRDWALLRRLLCDWGHMTRERDGTRYRLLPVAAGSSGGLMPRSFILGLALLALAPSCGDDSDPAGPAQRQSRIVFASARTTILPEIYVMNADGTGQVRLTYDAAGGGQPSWTPDGSHIVFHRRWQDATQRWWSGIFRMKDDGSEKVCIDSIPDAFWVDPRVSPDGSRIAFCQQGASGSEVWVMNADGSGAINLTPAPEQGVYPDWSPDGTRIAYSRNVPGLGWRIYTMKSDGSDTMKVVETGVANSHQVQPRWSHDGTRIAYVDTRGVTGNPHMNWIYVVHPDGTSRTPVTPLTDGYRDHPTWSPDDSKIAYRDGYRNGSVADAEIYTIGVDGSGETNVSRFSGGHDITPDWGPAP